MNNFGNFLNRLGLQRVAAMGVVAVLLLGFFAFLIFRMTTPQMAALYSGLSLEDSGAIVKELRTLNVTFDLRGDGEAILVPRDQITTLRMSLAESGLPARGQVGYEIFDKQNTLGATSFVQNINQIRALEGELARTISSLARIKSARVHLVLPERELFRRERKNPTASIVVSVRGELPASEIRAIQYLIASAIDDMSPAAVSIVDTAGRLLASGTDSGDPSALAGDIDERTFAAESRLTTKLVAILDSIVGAGRSKVQVSAELDLNRLTRTSETYDPDGQVVRSTQTRDLANSASGPGASGAVTVADELPGASAASGASGGTAEQATTTEETTNYEISKTTQTETTEAGRIKRVSVAVVVDGIYATDANGNATYEPRSAEQLAQIGALVRSAIGFDAQRGDQVEIANLQFAERPGITDLGSTAPGLFDFTRDDLINAAEMAVTLLIGLALIFFVIRPLVKRVLSPDTEPLTLPAAAEVPAGQAGPDGLPPELLGEGTGGETKHPAWMDNAKSLGENQLKTLQNVGNLVEENPKQATLIVRDWLTRAA